ncbi:MAG: ABC transporter substrate-binding protein [Pseudomonadota bacterium]
MAKKNVLNRDKRKYLLPMERKWGAETHCYLPELTDQLDRSRIDRRDFLRQACLLGMTSAAAYATADALLGRPLGSVAHAAETPKPGGTLRVSMAVQEMTDPATFDWTEKSNVARFIVEYLTRTRADNTTVPYLAERWEAGEDLKTWVFHLRKGIKWSNGDDFTAADVAHNMARWLDPATGSSNLGLFDAMVEEYDTGEKGADGKPKMAKRATGNAIEVIDDNTIKFNLRKAALAIPENFYNYPAAIVHRSFGKDTPADLSKHPIGTGPFDLAEFRVGERAILKKARKWWAGDFHLDEIHYFDHGQDTNAWVAAIISNQVDTMYRLPVESVETIKRIPTLDVLTTTTAQTAVARFRVTEKPFDNVNLRRAVLACMDHDELASKGFNNLGVPAQNDHVCPIHPDYADDMPKPKRDIELAKKLLKDAGYENGVKLTISNGDTDGPWMTSTLSVLKAQCAPAGIDVTINKMPSAQYWENWTKAPWGYTSWTHRPLGTMVLSLAYRSGVPWNESAYSDPAFDKALDEAEAELDVNARKEKLKVCRRILRDAAVIPQPFWRQISKAASKKVKGLDVHPTLYHQFQNVWLDS